MFDAAMTALKVRENRVRRVLTRMGHSLEKSPRRDLRASDFGLYKIVPAAGCAWCGPALARRWWAGMQQWITSSDHPVSLAVLPIRHQPNGLHASVIRLRRALRDVRDRTARRRRQWRDVAIAGMTTSDGVAMLNFRHAGIPGAEVAKVLRRRWPDAIIGDVESALPRWKFAMRDSVEVAKANRGVEPLRIVVLDQHRLDTRMPKSDVAPEPMPIVI
jgi:hypothetical protein